MAKKKNKKKSANRNVHIKSSRALKNRNYVDKLDLAYGHYRARKLPQAEQIVRQVLGKDSGHARANYLMGLLRHEAKNNALAIEHFKKAVASDPDFVDAINALGSVYTNTGQFKEAVKQYNKFITLESTNTRMCLQMARALRGLGQTEKAAAYYRRVLEIQPDFTEALREYGSLLADIGEQQAARAHFRRVLKLRPDSAITYLQLATNNKYVDYDDEIRQMESFFSKDGTTPTQKRYLGFALGKAFEDIHHYEKAFEYYLEANRLYRRTYQYSIEKSAAKFRHIIQTFTSEFLASRADMGVESRRPIFIVGMPRSGTSLAEQILASHSRVYGAGELPVLRDLVQNISTRIGKDFSQGLDDSCLGELANDYLAYVKEKSEGCAFTTDKMPHNFLRVGFIKLALPQATIIHCKRDSTDTCLSIFSNSFEKGHFYAYDLKELGQYYQLYQEMMAHWHQVLPGHIYDLDYEDLVSDPEPQIRRLLDVCGLPFEEACLSHHKTSRSVGTASNAQVRQPIYKQSVERWRRYEKQLQPLREALGLLES